MDWKTARDDFYEVAREGLNADINWIDRNGNEITDKSAIYSEVFSIAETGLKSQGFKQGDIEQYLSPIKQRTEKEVTPSIWKKEIVKEGLDDGLDLGGAIRNMQNRYIEKSRDTQSFTEWI